MLLLHRPLALPCLLGTGLLLQACAQSSQLPPPPPAVEVKVEKVLPPPVLMQGTSAPLLDKITTRDDLDDLLLDLGNWGQSCQEQLKALRWWSQKSQ